MRFPPYRALSLAFCVGLAFGADADAPPKPAPTPADPVQAAADAYRRGVEFLLKTQNGNGSWGSFESARADEVMTDTIASFRAFGDGSTALCVMALLAPAHDNPEAAKAVEKAVRFLAKAPPLMRASGEVMYNVWTHIYVLQAMALVLREERYKKLHSDAIKTAKRHIEGLGRIQGADGGFGYYDFGNAFPHPTGNDSCSFVNAAALVAFSDAKAAGLEVPSAVEQDGLRSLLRLRCSDGAYVYGLYLINQPRRLANRINGSLGRSQACNLALWKNKNTVTEADLKKGLDNLLQYHHFIEIGKGRPVPHEAWYQTAGYYFFFGHYYAARVAKELPADDGKKYLDALRDIMIRLQDADGSWWDFPLYGYHKAYGTAYALMVLERAR